MTKSGPNGDKPPKKTGGLNNDVDARLSAYEHDADVARWTDYSSAGGPVPLVTRLRASILLGQVQVVGVIVLFMLRILDP